VIRIVVDAAADAWVALAANRENAIARRWPGAQARHGWHSGIGKVFESEFVR